MKRIAIFVAALVCGFCAHAQTVDDEYKALKRAGFVRDSIIGVLDNYRDDYAQNKDKRKELAPKILALEKELMEQQAKYVELVAEISEREARLTVQAYEKALEAEKKRRSTKVVEVKPNEVPVVDEGLAKRDFVANSYFAAHLSPEDYSALLSTQQQEKQIKEWVNKYFENYAELLALYNQYMEATTLKQAEEIAPLFNAKHNELVELDAKIVAAWSPLYENKIYLYNLLMEREKNNSILNQATEVIAKADREVDDAKGKYNSDVLAGYLTRKRALTEYEMRIATHLMLVPTLDSLSGVMTELNNRDYRLSKLELARRNFIRYEGITVNSASMHNSGSAIPQIKVYDYGTVYRVCIGSFKKRVGVAAMRGVQPVAYVCADGEYLYYAGAFRTEKEAQNAVNEMAKVGFKTPFISAWVDGNYYPTIEDMNDSPNKYNIVISGVATLSEEAKAVITSHKSDCVIARVGSNYSIGSFAGISSAEAVVADLKSLGIEMEIKITKQ